ncbi:MAG: type IV pilus modification protein PilV [Moraxellaceae bacterium]|nr:MAG: type IV pilus modification protein PilV [Moraxellaceae bacterium]
MGLDKTPVGASLVEILVSLLILGIGVVGVVAMQLQSVMVVNDAYHRTQAIAIAQDVIERIKANPRGWPDLYVSQQWRGVDSMLQEPCAKKTMPVDVGQGCDLAEEIARYDHFEVSNLLAVALPQGIVHIAYQCSGNNSAACVEVAWENEGASALKDCRGKSLGTVEQVLNHHCVAVSFMAFQKL